MVKLRTRVRIIRNNQFRDATFFAFPSLSLKHVEGFISTGRGWWLVGYSFINIAPYYRRIRRRRHRSLSRGFRRCGVSIPEYGVPAREEIHKTCFYGVPIGTLFNIYGYP